MENMAVIWRFTGADSLPFSMWVVLCGKVNPTGVWSKFNISFPWIIFQKLFPLSFLFHENVNSSYKAGFISFFAVVLLCFTQSSNFKTFHVHFVDKVILLQSLDTFSGQWGQWTSFLTPITTFCVIAALDIQRLLRTDFYFIFVSISSDTRGGLPTFFIEKKYDFFSFTK